MHKMRMNTGHRGERKNERMSINEHIYTVIVLE
jgi:hypothetical protein